MSLGQSRRRLTPNDAEHCVTTPPEQTPPEPALSTARARTRDNSSFLERPPDPEPTWLRVVSWIWRHHQGVTLGVTTIGLVLLSAAVAGPVRTAVEIGADEHFEVTKGLLWTRGWCLYRQVWDDQPPLHTVLLGLCFQAFGPTIGVARALSVSFGAALLLGLWAVVKHQSGTLAAYAAAACLLVSPEVLNLSVSVMLEVPAFSISIWALWLTLKWQEERGFRWLVLSGILLAVALQVKLTAAIAAPAIVVQVALGGSLRSTMPTPSRQAFWNLAVWGAGLVAGFVVLVLALRNETYDLLWASHFPGHVRGPGSQAESYVFSPRLLLDHAEAVWCAGAGLGVLVWQCQWRRLAVPLVWLLTAAFVALTHRPWWSYYYLHFAIPLAWLTGISISESLRLTRAKAAASLFRLPFLGTLAAASMLIAFVATEGGARLASEVERLRDLPRVQDCALVGKMRQYAGGTHWVYTRFTIYPFHARLLVLPELAVLPLKRFWSGRITGEKIVATLKERRPEQLLLTTETPTPALQQLLTAEYALVYEDSALRLYVVKSLAGK